MRTAPHRVLIGLSCLAVGALPATSQIVFDPSVFARQLEQLVEMKNQVATMTSQLKVAVTATGGTQFDEY